MFPKKTTSIPLLYNDRGMFQNNTHIKTVLMYEDDETNLSLFKRITDKTFMGASSLTTVRIPEGIEEIGIDAFGGDANHPSPAIESIHFPNTLKRIEENAFEYCTHLSSVTIPLMKKTGIPAALAGATEAASSLGGQITPPVMGSAAFIMAEYLGVSYLSIVVAAALPAALYYVSVFTMIHFEAHKIGAIGLPKSELPKWKGEAARKCYLFLPVIILVTLLILGFSALYAPFAAFITAIVLSMIDKKTRLNGKKLWGILSSAGQTLTVVAIPCAAAGFVVGTAGLTGLTPALTSLLTALSQNNFVLTLVLTMVLCLLLGMGVPTTANYILMTIMTVPIMVKVGVMPLAAHLFCFYFGIMSELTPPVAITSYTASAIAGAAFWPTAFNAVRLAAVAYIVPYIFVFNTSLLIGTQPFTFKIFITIVTACIGALSFAIGMAGYIRRKMFLVERFLICAGACFAIKPGIISDWLGLGLIGLVFALQWIYKKNPKNYIPPEPKKMVD